MALDETDPVEIDLVDEIYGVLAEAATAQRRKRATRFALAFGLGAAASLVLISAVALTVLGAYSNRVVPGVHVGSIDVSGLSRDQVVARLQAAYGYLGQGEVTVTTPVGTATITYQEVGRGPNVEFMADAAMRIGHSGNPIGDAVYMLRSGITGQDIPVVVHVDPAALATRIRQLVDTSKVLPRDAQATVQGGAFAVQPSAAGRGLDAKTLSSAILDRLTQPITPADFQAGGALVTLDPYISDGDAQNAIAEAQKMSVDINLAWGGASAAKSASPSPSPSPGRSLIPTKTFSVDALTVRSWIVFRTNADGSYGPTADPGLVQGYLSHLSPKVAISPVEPKVVYDKSGKPTSLKAGTEGTGIDMAATSQAIVAYLGGLASGGSPSPTVAIVPGPIAPGVTLDSLSGMVIIGGGKGSWTTIFYPDVSNGYGANIRVPATLLNGQVVAPGQQFSFLRAVSPVDRAHGYALGGVIKGGKSDHTGAMGGGICSASTTMFNAAARSGLQIDERHAHYYYITRYPLGLDATVFSDGYQTWDLKWTNDTPNPIVIRAFTTYGSKSTITIQLWSLPLDRTVSFSPEFKANLIQPSDFRQYVSWLKPGQQNRPEYPTIGFDTSRTRTVTDSSGNVIHVDTWNSHYTKVDGILQIGRSSAPPPIPAPSPAAPASSPAAPVAIAPPTSILPGHRA